MDNEALSVPGGRLNQYSIIKCALCEIVIGSCNKSIVTSAEY